MPRLPVRAEAVLVALQFDEYGAGDPNCMHAHLFARGMESVGLRSKYGAYVCQPQFGVSLIPNTGSVHVTLSSDSGGKRPSTPRK